MAGAAETERTIRTFASLEDIVNAMKAYAGVTIKRTEEMVVAVRAYEEQVQDAIARIGPLAAGAIPAPERSGGPGIIVAFGSSQGLCGALNEHVAEALGRQVRPGDAVLVVGRRLPAAAAARGVAVWDALDSVASVSGIRPALERTVARVLDRYRREAPAWLDVLYTAVVGSQGRVLRPRLLPPPTAPPRLRGWPPLLTLPARDLFDGLLRELIAIGLYRAFAESLRSENWYRMRVLEGATENLKRRVEELRSLRNYQRQQEVTEEVLEILASAGLFAR